MHDAKPRIWIFDSVRRPLVEIAGLFDGWAEAAYFAPDAEPDWNDAPEAVFFSDELPGGAGGESFAELLEEAGGVPLLAVSRLRSFAQAVAFFRAGATDYLSLPLDEDDLRERLAAALERAAAFALRGAAMEFETLDGDPGENGSGVRAAAPAGARPQNDPDDEPVAVEGLPIPALWEELPCGLAVFDSDGCLGFSNSLGLDLFGAPSIADLRQMLETGLASLSAYAANHKPLADNQWPHILARKTRTPRSAVLSLEKPDRRRVWLRIDCLPHIAEGDVTRLTMTMVNLTGDLPPLSELPSAVSASSAGKKGKGKGRGKRKR